MHNRKADNKKYAENGLEVIEILNAVIEYRLNMEAKTTNADVTRIKGDES